MTDNDTHEEEVPQFESEFVDVFKKWRQSGNSGGFINFQYWPKHHRIAIDIGSTENGALVKSAKCYLKAAQFMAYLKAEVEGNLNIIFPEFHSSGKSAGWTTYGGSYVDGQLVSRIFKIVPWQGDTTARDFRCGWFEGIPQGQGAVKPNLEKPIKSDHIKMTQFEIAELYQMLSMVIQTQQLKLAFNNDG